MDKNCRLAPDAAPQGATTRDLPETAPKVELPAVAAPLRWLITIAVVVTSPLWFVPAAIGLAIWMIHDAIWNHENDY